MSYSAFKLSAAQKQYKYLSLSDSENRFYISLLDKFKRINSTADSYSLCQFLNFIKEQSRTKLGILIKLAIHHPWLRKICSHRDMKEHWNQRWIQYGANPENSAKIAHDSSRPSHNYTPQITIPTFDLLMGIYCYSAYKATKKPSQQLTIEAETYIRLAGIFGCGHALRDLMDIYINKITTQADTVTTEDILILQEIGEQLAKLYFAPGYHALSIIYQAIAVVIPNIIDDDPSHAQFLKREYYHNATSALITANALLPYSDAMINNLYGKEATPVDITKLLQLFSEHTEPDISRRMLDYDKGNNEARKLLVKFNVISPSTSHSNIDHQHCSEVFDKILSQYR